MASLFSGLIGDLEHASRASLLIEIQRKHIEEIVKEHPTFKLKNYCDNIFNKGLPQLKTNVVVIDASNKKQAQLLHAVIRLIEDSLKRKKEVDSALNLGLHFATLGLSEFIDGSITDNVANYIDETWDIFQENVSHFLGKKVEEKIVGKAEEGTEQLINSTKVYYQPGTTLYLSKKAKAKFTSLTNKLIKKHSPSDAMQFLVELVATLGDDAPKLLVVNDPFSLDAESLSFCTLLMSYAKDLKQQGRTLPVSMVFNYTSKQPYDNESQEEKNFQPLLRLRHMMQRYDMLEKPDSNIPSPAIKSTTFVGRQEELAQLMRQHDELLEASFKSEGVRICQWTLIKGEPGTGKTALINRHLTELEKLSDDASKSQIRLRLLNQVGHSSQVTGLASLLQSIHEEASRLSQCYKESNGLLSYYIKEKVNKYKKSARDIVSLSEEVLRTKKVTSNEVKTALKAIADIANKEKLYASAEAMYDRTKIKGSAKQSAEAFTEGGTQNKKQEAFDNLSNALRHLCSIANAVSPVNKKMPLILVIDDLQWVDELSAEYILEHLVGNYSIELLITSRDSDSQTSYKLAQAKSKELPYTIRLFDKSNMVNLESIDTTEKQSKTPQEDVTQLIFLEGMDRQTIITLINSTFKVDENKIDVGVIADALIKCLSDQESDEDVQVNTLFVIEALNLLSDPAFYRRHNTVKPLFKKNDNGKYSLNVDLAEAFVSAVKDAFNLLENAHINAYRCCELKGRESQYFSLASFAILEERLLIIAQYLGGKSNHVLFGLQLSAVIGEPFNSELVNTFLDRVMESRGRKYDDLKGLRDYLSDGGGSHYCASTLDILEESFEIIKRMRRGDGYIFKHGLLRSYLIEKFSEALNHSGVIMVYGDMASPYLPNLQQKIDQLVKDRLYERNSSIEYFMNLFLKVTFEYFGSQTNKVEGFSHQRIINNFLNFIGKYHPLGFTEEHFDLFNTKVNEVGKDGTADQRAIAEVRKMADKANFLLKYIYLNNAERWAGRYAATLFNLGMAFKNSGPKSIEYFEEAYEIVKLRFKDKPEYWEDAMLLLIDRIGLECRHPTLFTSEEYEIENYLTKAKQMESDWERMFIDKKSRNYRNKKGVEELKRTLNIDLTSFSLTSLNLEDIKLRNLEIHAERLVEVFKRNGRAYELAEISSLLLEMICIYEVRNMLHEVVRKSEQIISFVEMLRPEGRKDLSPLSVLKVNLGELYEVMNRHGFTNIAKVFSGFLVDWELRMPTKVL